MAKPILVLQMQRMGDLILSFPLFLWLKKTYPNRAIHVVAEKNFFDGLVGLSPGVLYIPWQAKDKVLSNKYSLVINLSHRSEAAWLAGRVKSKEITGAYADDQGVLRVAGKWQLYRSSIVQNNRYNRFHWAELNALDVIDPAMMKMTRWKNPVIDPGSRRVGVFIGASQESKRPGPDFFALLCKELIRRQYQPVILGGPDEKKLAKNVLKLCSVRPLSLAGRLSLDQLAGAFKGLGLIITPDTGPMHLAAWMGLPTLNLSLGPVNPWETGPYQPGHMVMRSNISCSGCWECIQKSPLCVDAFKVRQVILVMEKMMSRDLSDFEGADFRGVNVHETGRKKGFYDLFPVKARETAAVSLASFWQSFWKFQLGPGNEKQVVKAAAVIREKYPFVMKKFRQSSVSFVSQLKAIVRKGSIPDSGFWKQSPPYFRPFAGYAHLMWQNEDYGPASLSTSIKMVQDLLDIIQDG